LIASFMFSHPAWSKAFSRILSSSIDGPTAGSRAGDGRDDARSSAALQTVIYRSRLEIIQQVFGGSNGPCAAVTSPALLDGPARWAPIGRRIILGERPVRHVGPARRGPLPAVPPD